MTFRAYASMNTNSTSQPSSISGSYPTACVAGDVVLICAIQSTGTNTITIASSGPTTPTLLSGPDRINSNLTAYLWSVPLASGDVGGSVTLTASAGAYFIGAMAAFAGRATSTPVFTEGTASATASLTTPTVTTTADLSDVAFFYTTRVASTTHPTVTTAGSQTKAGEAYTAAAVTQNYAVTAAYRTTPGGAGAYGGSVATVSPTATSAVLYTVGLAPLVTTSSGFKVYKVNSGGTTTRVSVYKVNSGGTTTQIASSTD